jgi:hypothetical protein
MQAITGQGRGLPGDTYTHQYFEAFGEGREVTIQIRATDHFPI